MIIGVPKEIKTREYRVGMTPAGVRSLTSRGHKVLVETRRRRGQRHQGRRVRRAGATIVPTAAEAWGARDGREGEGAARRPSTASSARASSSTRTCTSPPSPSSPRSSRRAGSRGIAYETIQLDDGSLPLLRPMSEVAGRMAVQVGATCLEKERGGKGVLLGGVPGTRRGRVVILGGGVVGRNAATIAIGMGAQVTVLDVRADDDGLPRGRLRRRHRDALLEPDQHRESRACAPTSSSARVLVTGAAAPKLVTEELIGKMEQGLASSSTSRSTRAAASRRAARRRTTTRRTRSHGVVHYCVANMPGAVPHTSTWALTNTTIAYAREDRRAGRRRRGQGRQGAARRASTRTAATSRTSPSRRRTSSSTCPSPSCSADRAPAYGQSP